jgi:hypothetical protein
MITESAQLLSSAYYFTPEQPEAIYALSHANHPCAKWVRASLTNWVWLRDLGLELYKEYQYRYGPKEHRAGEVIVRLPLPQLPDVGLTPFALCVPEECKVEDAVQSYRNYYNMEKQHLFAWKKRNPPEWIEKKEET